MAGLGYCVVKCFMPEIKLTCLEINKKKTLCDKKNELSVEHQDTRSTLRPRTS